jgi:hypothetical protein
MKVQMFRYLWYKFAPHLKTSKSKASIQNGRHPPHSKIVKFQIHRRKSKMVGAPHTYAVLIFTVQIVEPKYQLGEGKVIT